MNGRCGLRILRMALEYILKGSSIPEHHGDTIHILVCSTGFENDNFCS